jgi:hypothetical protein
MPPPVTEDADCMIIDSPPIKQQVTTTTAPQMPVPYQWVTQEEINWWMVAIVEAHQTLGPPTERGLLSTCDSMLLPQLQMHREDERFLVTQAKRWHPTMRLDRVHKCFVPLHLDAVHWALLVIMPREHLFCVYDSLNPAAGLTPSTRQSLWMFTRFLRVYGAANGVPELMAAPWIPISCPYAEAQADVVSCGVYVAVAASLNARFCREFVSHIKVSDPESMHALRRHLDALTLSRSNLRALAQEHAEVVCRAWYELLASHVITCLPRRIQHVFSPSRPPLSSSIWCAPRLSDAFAFRCLDPWLSRDVPVAMGHLPSPNFLDVHSIPQWMWQGAPARLVVAGEDTTPDVALVHPGVALKQLQLELYENMVASAASFASVPAPDWLQDAGEEVYVHQSRAVAASHSLGARTTYTRRLEYELRILGASLDEILHSLHEEGELLRPSGGMPAKLSGSRLLVGASGELPSFGDLLLPSLTARAIVRACAQEHQEKVEISKARPAQLDVALAGGACARVYSRLREQYDAAALSYYVDPSVFLREPVSSPSTPRVSYKPAPAGARVRYVPNKPDPEDTRARPATEEEETARILWDMVALDNMCCLRSTLSKEARLLVLPDEQAFAGLPPSLQDAGERYDALLWVRDEGIYKGHLHPHMGPDKFDGPLIPLSPTRRPRHVCSMLRWGITQERCLLSWQPSSSSSSPPLSPTSFSAHSAALPGEATCKTFLLCVHWISKQEVWKVLLGGSSKCTRENMNAHRAPPVTAGAHFPFIDLFELH